MSFDPALAGEGGGRGGLPLGLADKLFLSLEGAEEFEKDSALFGHTDRTATARLSFPAVRSAADRGAISAERSRPSLEAGGEAAFSISRSREIVGLLRRRIRRGG